MRPDEEFVAHALVEFLGGPDRAQYEDGADPPDIHLTFDGQPIGVEVTRLSQLTLRPDGTLAVRETEDTFGVRLSNQLDQELGHFVPDDLCLLLSFEVPVTSPKAFRRELTSWVKEVARLAKPGQRNEKDVGDSHISLSVHPRSSGRKKIIGIVSNRDSSPDIGWNAGILLANRISAKSQSCRLLRQRLWLALFNDYWLADHETYQLAARDLRIEHPFERIFLVADQGSVSELSIKRIEAR